LNDAVSRSSYIAPSAVDLHTYWYYEQAGSGGWGNPEPEQLELENAAMLANRFERAEASASAGGQSIREHVSGLADGIRTADGYTELLVARWIADLESSIAELANDLRESLRDLATVLTFVQRWNLVWLLSYLV
jgi:hypothetical protein